MPPENPADPSTNWITMEILIVILILLLFAWLRPRLSVDRPGKVQHLFEALFGFIQGQASESVEHGSAKYVAFFATLFIFILFMNLIGIIPGFESPTMTPAVPLGLAVSGFLYYNWMGFRAQGVVRYLLHFAVPVWWLAPIMIPIEIISHLARPLSLTVRL